MAIQRVSMQIGKQGQLNRSDKHTRSLPDPITSQFGQCSLMNEVAKLSQCKDVGEEDRDDLLALISQISLQRNYR